MAVTVYTPGVALGSNDDNPNTTFRVLVQLSANSNGQLAVRFRSSTAGALNIAGASFGKWNGTTLSASSCDMTTTPFRLTFSASNTVSISTNSTATSDFITHTGLTLNTGDWVIVCYFCNATNGGQRFSTGHTTATTVFKQGASDQSQAQTAADMGNSLSIIGNVQPGGSGGYNYAVDLVQTNDGAAFIAKKPIVIHQAAKRAATW